MISVIIPNYNNADYLRNAIQSVLNQTFTDYEIIVVDDGSTDNSKDIVEAFGAKVRYIWQENKGLAGARNTGIQAARGKIVGLLDADDEWLPTYLENMIALTRRFPEAAVYYCSAQGMDAEGNELPQVFGGPAISSEMMYQTLLRANFLIPSTIILRHSMIAGTGLFDPKLRHCEDWDLWLRILPRYNFIGTSKCLVRYRLHGNSLSVDVSGQQETTRAIIENHFGPDDGQPQNWTAEKRRAYGGVYRLYVLTSTQRQNDWQAASRYFYLALYIDPTLAMDLNLFYDLALGSQSPGYRGASPVHEFEKNAIQLTKLINTGFDAPDLASVHRRVCGTAFYALGLVSYNSGMRSLSREYFARALYYRPDLIFDARLVGDFLRSFLSRESIKRIKKAVERLS